MSKEIQNISIDSLAASGIQASLNQNDIVEIVVQKRYDQITSKIEELNRRSTELSNVLINRRKEVMNTLKEKVRKELKLNDNVSVSVSSPYRSDKSENKLMINRIISEDYRNGERYFVTNNTFLLPAKKSQPILEDFSISVHITTSKKTSLGVVEEGINYRIDIENQPILTAAEITAWKKEAEKLNKEIAEFWETLPKTKNNYVHLSTSKLSQEVRNQVNSKILKNQAPKLIAQIEQMFGVSL